MEVKFIKPYDDKAMVYDKDEHRYILTIAYVEEKTGLNLVEKLNTSASDNPQRVAHFFLDRISSTIYEWVYQHNANNTMQEFLMAKLESTRDTLKRAMLEQVMYVLTNGDLSLYGGVNVANGQIMDRKAMHNADIGINVERILNTIIPVIGIALTYQGHITTPIGLQIRSDY